MIDSAGAKNLTPKTKTIFHLDGDAFFVGVEVAKNPKLKGLPVVTGEERGIVSALSYEAKALGLSRAVPIYQVKKNFPQVIILPGDYESYVRYSGEMFDIVRRYADDVEEYSIDECFADLTGLEPPLRMTYRQITERIKREINGELRLSISIGLAPTKVLAKVASKWKKPDGLTIIEADRAAEYLSQTPIEKIWGIGPSTSHFLMRQGIKTALDLAGKSESWVGHFLSKPYHEIWQELNCISVHAIDPNKKETYSSIQKTRTFHPPTNNPDFLLSQLSKNIEEACAKARRYNLAPKKLSLFLKSQSFRYTNRSVTLLSRTNAPELLIPIAHKEFRSMHAEGTLYRTTGVTLHDLAATSVVQGDLFGATERANKFDTIHKQLDNLETKLGKRLVHLGSTQKALKRKVKGTDSDDLDRDLLFL